MRISPGGVVKALDIPETVQSATAMALDAGNGLYISDGISRQLFTLRTDGSSLTLLSGLKRPKGVATLNFGPVVVDQAARDVFFVALQNSAFNFGSVAVGTSATQTFTILAQGNYESDGTYSVASGTPFTISGGSYSIQPGASQTMTITFTLL